MRRRLRMAIGRASVVGVELQHDWTCRLAAISRQFKMVRIADGHTKNDAAVPCYESPEQYEKQDIRED